MAEWQDPKNFAIGLSIALLIMIVLVISIIALSQVYYKRIIQEQAKLALTKLEHQQTLLWSSVLVQEKERERIASDLHDGLISKLTVLMYALQTDNPQIKPAEVLQDSIRIAREITHDLSPPLLEQTSLQELVENFVSPLSTVYTLDNFYGLHRLCEVKTDIKLQLLRLVQELINNILKHAKATKITIRLRVTNVSISLIISDNGVGFDTSRNASGLGLKNIELRSQLLNAKWRFKSKPSLGTTFQLYLKNDFIIPLT
ncbi:MAG: ATP-binding protein [Bacteroidia bacterium]|nr:ATP-binding protein [Bacteroidia bacterium]